MLASDNRRKKIVESVIKKGFMTVVELAEDFNVTTATIRTDLNALEQKQLLVRSHGGAIPSVTKVINLKNDEKAGINKDLKVRIAIAAAQLVDPDDSITIASGSTMGYFARAISQDARLNIVTPSLRIASDLIDNPMVSVFLLGGEVSNLTCSAYGSYAAIGLDIFHTNKLFFGVEGFSVEDGLSCGVLDEGDLTKQMIKSSTKIIVLADSTKFRRRGFCHICNLKDIDILVTDSGLSEEAQKAIIEQGIELIIA